MSHAAPTWWTHTPKFASSDATHRAANMRWRKGKSAGGRPSGSGVFTVRARVSSITAMSARASVLACQPSPAAFHRGLARVGRPVTAVGGDRRSGWQAIRSSADPRGRVQLLEPEQQRCDHNPMLLNP